jgi:large subunit ribosomal protein L9
MKIILQRTVEKLGDPGDVVEVADGYARNYLVPRGLAVVASKGAVRHAESLKRAHEVRVAKAADEARVVADKLAALDLRIGERAGEDGRLFGSVTSAEIADEIARATGGDLEVDRKDIHLDEPIRSLGTHKVRVKLHRDVDAEVSVTVEAAE